MSETGYSRSRRVAVLGLVVQTLGCGAALLLGHLLHSLALQQLAGFIAGGLPIWLAAVLVFRQHELAAWEAMDLEELRRERQASGGGEAIFGPEGGGSLGFMVAQARLAWMQRYLVPALGLVTAGWLIGAGLWNWRSLPALDDPQWTGLTNVPLGVVALSVLMLALFLPARYASGLGRVSEWQLLRACGSYMFGNSLAAMAIIVSLGAYLYGGVESWEHVLARAIPLLMIVLGLETLLNFILDIYRPRTPGTQPRAAFDSRILGLISEPGGIAHTLSEAINYQFGFQVSQTWFYQLLERTFLPLAGAGALALWLLTCLVVVEPYEHAIIERLGRQVHPERPLGPGLHFKLPAPLEIARKYPTDQLYQIVIGHATEDGPRPPRREARSDVEQWTDPRHGGLEHFNFIVSLPPRSARLPVTRPGVEGGVPRDRAVPVHLLRMNLVVQYKLDPQRLAAHTRSVQDPHDLLRHIAWEETARFVSSQYVDAMLGEARDQAGQVLRERIARRAAQLDLGFEIRYVGLLEAHPAPGVAEAFRRVINARQERTAEIRKARVTESERLSRVAGERTRALLLAAALDNLQHQEVLRAQADTVLRAAGVVEDPRGRQALEALRGQLTALAEAQWRLDRARSAQEQIQADIDMGLGRGAAQLQQAEQEVQEARLALDQIQAQVQTALEPLRADLRARLARGRDPQQAEAVAEALIARAQAEAAIEFWNGRIESELAGVEGQAAEILAAALAKRWELEMDYAAQLTRVTREREAYRAAPEVYRARRYLEVLGDGLRRARKYFAAFEPGERQVRIRVDAQDTAGPDITDLPAGVKP